MKQHDVRGPFKTGPLWTRGELEQLDPGHFLLFPVVRREGQEDVILFEDYKIDRSGRLFSIIKLLPTE